MADLLAGLDVLTDLYQVRAGVPVVDRHAVERAGGDLQDRRVGAKTADPLADDDAIAHRVQRRAARSRVVNPLVDRAIDEIAAGKGQGDTVAQHIGRRLGRRCRGRDHSNSRCSPRSPGSRARRSTHTTPGAWAGGGADTCRPVDTGRQTNAETAARAAGSSRSGLAASARSTRRLPTRPRRRWRGVAPAGVCADATSRDGPTLAPRRRSAGKVPPAVSRRSRYRRGRPSAQGVRRHAGGQAGGLVQHQHGGLEHDRPRPDVDRAGHSEAVTALEVAHRAPRLRTKDPVHRQMRQRDDLVQAPLSRRHQSSLTAHP